MASNEARTAFLFDANALKSLLQYVGPDLAKTIQNDLEECDRLFRFDKMFLCAEKLESLVNTLTGMVESSRPQVLTVERPTGNEKDARVVGELSPMVSVLGISLVADFIKQTPMYVTSIHKSVAGRKLIQLCEELDAWNPQSVDKVGNGTYYRPEPGCDFHSFLTRGIVKAPLMALASVLLELDMYVEWFPMANLSEELLSVMTYHKQARFAVTVPGPIIANREVCLDGYGIDDLPQKRVVIVARGLEDDEVLANGDPVPQVKKGNVRCGMSACGFIITALDLETTHVSFMMNIDPRIPHVPKWVLNFVSSKMMGVLLSQMSKAAQKSASPKSKYHQRRQERKEVYDYMQRMLEQLEFSPERRD